METGIDIVDRETAYVSTDDPALIRRIRRLGDENPGNVQVRMQPEKNDGCLCCIIPRKWVKISPPRKVEYSQERKAELANRMKNLRLKSRMENENE